MARLRLPSAPLLATAIFILITIGYPVALLVAQSVFPEIIGGSWRGFFSAYLRIFETPGLGVMLLNSVAWAGCTTLGAWLFGVPCGYLLARTDLAAKGLARVLLLMPLMTPSYLTALAYVLAIQPGGLGDTLIGPVPEGLRAIFFSFWGVTFIMVVTLFGGVALVVEATLLGIPSRLEDAAASLGASRFTTLRRIVLPLLLPAMLNSGILVFLDAISNFGVPAIMGPRCNLPLLPAEIYALVTSWPVDIPLAAALATILSLLAVVLLSLSRWWLNRRPPGRSRTAVVRPRPLSRMGQCLAWAWLAALFALSAGLPMAVTVASSFVDRWQGGAPSWTLRHYQEVFRFGSEGWQALETSFMLSTITASVTTVVGGLAAYALARNRGWWAGAVDTLSLLPRILPNIVVAIAMIMAWNAPWIPLNIYGTVWLLVVAYLALYQAEAFRYGDAGMRQIGLNLEQAAESLGASRRQILQRIVVPMLAPSLMIAWIITFILCIRDWVASVILLPPDMATTGSFIFNQFEQGDMAKAMAMATATLVLSTLVLVALQAAQRRASSQ
jgi:iron(III) transport system permease protein